MCVCFFMSVRYIGEFHFSRVNASPLSLFHWHSQCLGLGFPELVQPIEIVVYHISSRNVSLVIQVNSNRAR